jgi:hypothetical protein
MKGRWVSVSILEVADAWLFLTPDNFMNGQGDALLTNATCPTARLEGQSGGVPDPSNLNGIWSEDCFLKAIGG